MPRLEHTSVPPWAVPGGTAPARDQDGAAYVLLGVGPEAGPVLDGWAEELRERPLVRFDSTDLDTATARLGEALAEARVGVRVRVAAPSGACLALRGVAFTAGVEDDEMHLAPTALGPIDLFCVHCRSVTSTDAAIDDVVPCAGCARNLLIYHHVSRRNGRFLGFQVDAETPKEEVS